MRTVVQAEGASSDQGGVLAQAVASQNRRTRTTNGVPGAPRADAGGQQGRLGVFGTVEHFLRATLGQRPQVDAGTIGCLGEGLTHLRVQFGQLGQHAHRLRALTGEDKSEGG
ncbi:hypothetical protein D3C73_973940 [compost metagenome]